MKMFKKDHANFEQMFITEGGVPDLQSIYVFSCSGS